MSAKSEVLSAFNQFRDALKGNDVATLDAMLAPDYRGYSLRGELEGREMILQAYRPGIVTIDRFETDDIQVEAYGEIGIVTGRGYLAGVAGGERWEHDLRFCDIYRQGETGWRLLLSQATPLEGE